MFRRLAFSLIAVGTGLFDLEAEPLTINNPGFETQTVADGVFLASSTPPTFWSAYDPSGLLTRNYNSIGVLNPGPNLYTAEAPERENVALVFLWPQIVPDQNRPAGLSQTLSSTLQPNTQYTLSVKVGNIADDDIGSYTLDGFPGYQVQLLANNVLLSQDNNTLAPAEGTFQQSTVQFTTGSIHAQLGQALQIRLINLNIPNSGIEVNFDDVRLDAQTVPEPTGLGLLALGLGIASIARRGRSARR